MPSTLRMGEMTTPRAIIMPMKTMRKSFVCEFINSTPFLFLQYLQHLWQC